MPLIAEILIAAAGFYLVGFGLGWLLFRPRRQGFL